jgi:mRNA interferase RelE/StbE
LAYELRFTTTAVKQLRKLDRTIARRVVDYLEAVADLDDPTVRGKNLAGEYRDIWRYQIGSYRALCDVDKQTLTILTLEVSHRSQSYRRK